MFSVPASRYILYPIPWYSFLIVLGVVLAVFLACREERRLGLKKDTVIDLVLWLLPAGILGARIYYVIFSWGQFRSDPLAVFRIWEGGLAIYGGVLAGLIVLVVFARHRKLSPLLLCDIIAPGLVLAQAIGRWGNYFNMEAYGLPLLNQSLCFFPLAVRIPENGVYVWHMATFFYESLWDLSIFCFLMVARRKLLRFRGDVFFFYAFLYAAGRFVIEELRMDSLFLSSSVRVSQLLSALVCLGVLLRYLLLCRGSCRLKSPVRFLCVFLAFPASAFQLVYSFFGTFLSHSPLALRLLLLTASSVILIVSLFILYLSVPQEVSDADHPL